MKPADGASSWRKRNQRLQEEIERLRKELEARATRRPSPSGSFAGTSGFDKLKPIKKFTDRKAATTRIWEAIQNLGAAPAPKAATPAPRAAAKPAKRASASADGARAPPRTPARRVCHARSASKRSCPTC
jgi:hypothetical protein